MAVQRILSANGIRHRARRVSLLAAFRRPGILLLLPLLLALAARVLVAPGWMIESDAGGSITVRICSDPTDPGKTVTIALEKAGSHDAGETQQHCPWGALANAPIVPGEPLLLAAPMVAAPTPVAVRSLGFAPGIASPLPPSTGPPAFA
ncbi:hypothetical protein [Sphingopyxis sp.]|uniref:hypothetical protein n=1 Tax=Sphingopyxis sp. TaxID=1908224 RepID=UPI003D0E97C2